MFDNNQPSDYATAETSRQVAAALETKPQYSLNDLVFRKGFMTFCAVYSEQPNRASIYLRSTRTKDELENRINAIMVAYKGGTRNALPEVAALAMTFVESSIHAAHLKLIADERVRQLNKWGEGQQSGCSNARWATILMEEIGELARAVLELKTDDPAKVAHMREEAVQVAAVCAAWFEHYKLGRGESLRFELHDDGEED